MYTNAKLAILFHINNNFLFFLKKKWKKKRKIKIYLQTLLYENY